MRIKIPPLPQAALDKIRSIEEERRACEPDGPKCWRGCVPCSPPDLETQVQLLGEAHAAKLLTHLALRSDELVRLREMLQEGDILAILPGFPPLYGTIEIQSAGEIVSISRKDLQDA